MSENKKNVKALIDKYVAKLQVLKQYRVALFIVFIGLAYGSLLFQVQAIYNSQPTQDAIAAQVKASQVPKIDETAIKQLQSLQDNSVNVQTLFNEARSNPFQ
jgi:hypothetical protein